MRVAIGLAVVSLCFFVSCSTQVRQEVAYKGRLKVEQQLDVTAVKSTAIEVRVSQKDASVTPFRTELNKWLPKLLTEKTQFKKVTFVDTARATASNAPYVSMKLEYEEPAFMNQYNGELRAAMEFYSGGKVVAKATAIGTTKDDQTKVGNGRVMFKTSGPASDPVVTASTRAAGFITAFLEGKDSQVEGSLF